MAMSLEKLAIGVVFGIVGIVLVFILLSALAPTLIAAAGNMSASTLPLANLFAASGVVITILMVFVLVAAVRLASKLGK